MIYVFIFIIGILIGFSFKNLPKKEYKDFSLYMCPPPTTAMTNRKPPEGGSGAMISNKSRFYIIQNYCKITDPEEIDKLII